MNRVISILLAMLVALYGAIAFFGGPFAVSEFLCNREELLCWLSPTPSEVAEPVLKKNATQLDGRLRLEANWPDFVGLTLRSRDYLFGLRTKMFVVATFRNADNELLIDTIPGVDGDPLMLYGPDRRHLLIAFKRISGEIELRLYVTDKRFLARSYVIDCRGGRRERLEISNLSFDPAATNLKFDLQADCSYGKPELGGREIGEAGANETVGVKLTQDFYIQEVATLSAEVREAAAQQRIEAGRTRFLECASKQVAEVRRTYPNMRAVALYCWAWQYLGAPGPAPGNMVYRALIVTPAGEQPLLQDNCAATDPSDLFVAGDEVAGGVAVSPNADHAMVACRTYSTVYKPDSSSDEQFFTEWLLTLATSNRSKQIPIRCKCREIQIDRARFDAAAGQLLISLSIKRGDQVWVAGKSLPVATPQASWMYVRMRVALTLEQSLAVRDVQALKD